MPAASKRKCLHELATDIGDNLREVYCGHNLLAVGCAPRVDAVYPANTDLAMEERPMRKRREVCPE